MILPTDQDASGRTIGDEEIALVTEVLRCGILNSTKGSFTKKLESTFASMLGTKHCIAASSGTMGIHAAISAIDPAPGDEIITSPITDMGAITPILYQGAIPVFCDVDRYTCNVNCESIRAKISKRTKAIIVTHLFGNPAEIHNISSLAKEYGIPVIEDCSQAFLAQERGRKVGTIGDIGCFSLQQGKHITTGEGGLVVTANEHYSRRLRLFVNKAWGYGDTNPDHYFISLNGRISELQSAVGCAQMQKLENSVSCRKFLAKKLEYEIQDIPGITLPQISSDSECVFWKYWFHVDPDVVKGDVLVLAAELKSRGVNCAPRYIQKPAFECDVIKNQRTFGDSRWPFTLATKEAVDYNKANYTGVYQALQEIIVLPWTEKYNLDHIKYISNALRDSLRTISSRYCQSIC